MKKAERATKKAHESALAVARKNGHVNARGPWSNATIIAAKLDRMVNVAATVQGSKSSCRTSDHPTTTSCAGSFDGLFGGPQLKGAVPVVAGISFFFSKLTHSRAPV